MVRLGCSRKTKYTTQCDGSMTELVLNENSGKLERACTTEEVEERKAGVVVLSESASGFNRGMVKGTRGKSKRKLGHWLWVAVVLICITGGFLWSQWSH